MTTPNYSRSRIPRYMQVAAAMRRWIEFGQWQPGDRIPSLPELQEEFAVARVTIRQAVEILEQEGLLRRVQGTGTFVASILPDNRWLRLDLRWESIASYIGGNVPQFVEIRQNVHPPARSSTRARAGGYHYFVSRQFRGEEPFSFARAHVRHDLVERDPEAFMKRPALAVIASMPGLAIGSARQSFVIGAADSALANHLRIGIGAPTAEAHVEVENPEGELLYHADIVYRGDCVRLDVDLLPPQPRAGDPKADRAA